MAKTEKKTRILVIDGIRSKERMRTRSSKYPNTKNLDEMVSKVSTAKNMNRIAKRLREIDKRGTIFSLFICH